MSRTRDRGERGGRARRDSGGAVAAGASPAASSGSEAFEEPSARLLLAGSAREILARIVPGDPLGLREAVGLRLRERHLLLDADRVHLRALARAARFAVRYRGRPALHEWLQERVDEAVEDLRREQAGLRVRPLAEGAGGPGAPADRGHRGDPRDSGAWHALGAPIGLDPEVLPAVCAAFNACPRDERRAFFRLVIEGASLDEEARRAAVSGSEYARRARRALDAILQAAEDAGSGPPARPLREPPRKEAR